MLALASRMMRDSLRIAHLPTGAVFSNWREPATLVCAYAACGGAQAASPKSLGCRPSGKTPLHYVHSVAFSPNCGYLAVGNARGRVLLYRLHHYDQC